MSSAQNRHCFIGGSYMVNWVSVAWGRCGLRLPPRIRTALILRSHRYPRLEFPNKQLVALCLGREKEGEFTAILTYYGQDAVV